MRDAVFVAALLALLPMAAARPFAGVLLWSWISFMSPHRLVWGQAAYMPWAMVVILATAVGCIMAQEPRRPAVNLVTGLFLALLVAITLTTFAALGTPESAWAKWDQTMKTLVALLLTAALLTDRARIHAMIWVMVIAIGYYGVRGGAFAIMTGGNYRIWGPEQTMIGDNNHIAAAMLVSLPLMNYLRLQSRHNIVRLGLWAAMGLTLLATVSTYSRGALLGLVAAAGIMWLRTRRKLTTGLLMVGLGFAAISYMPDSWMARMNTLQTYEQDGSATERLVLWEISFKLALDRPLFGSGFTGPYQRDVVDTVAPGGPARAVHSIYFEFLGEHGFVAFAIWLGVTFAGLFYTFRLGRLTRDRPDLAWAGDLARMAQVSIAAYLVSGTFLSLSYWDYYWTLLVVIAAAHTLVLAAIRGEAPAVPSWRTRAFASAGGRLRPVPGDAPGDGAVATGALGRGA